MKQIFLSILALQLFTFGCGSTKHDFSLVLHGTNALNTNKLDQPIPIEVRIYTLRHKERFEKATFLQLWKEDDAVLGDDMVSRRRVTLHPNSSHLVELEVDSEKVERFIAVMGIFRKPRSNLFKKIIPIDEAGFFSFGSPEVSLSFDEGLIFVDEPDGLPLQNSELKPYPR